MEIKPPENNFCNKCITNHGSKVKFVLFALFITTAIFSFYYANVVENENTKLHYLPRKSVVPNGAQLRRDKGIILAWRHPGGNEKEGYSPGQYGNCTLTYNRSLFYDAMAVVFDFSAFDAVVGLEGYKRFPDQVFVWNTMESPATLRHTHKRNFKNFDFLMNWTMTYRRDSDILSPYTNPDVVLGLLDHHSGTENVNKLLATKHNMALWMVSNCQNTKGAAIRLKLVQSLVDAGLPVQRYGGCFNNKAALEALPAEEKNSFKFYLSFENTHRCKDYITEKFWYNGIGNRRVPVVWGPAKQDLLELAPKGSFIHWDDFESPGKLVEYLKYLDKNQTAYREYFKWLEFPEDTKNWFNSVYKNLRLVGLCDKVKSNPKSKVIPSIDDVFFNSESQECIG